jgi:hypothetical protein
MKYMDLLVLCQIIIISFIIMILHNYFKSQPKSGNNKQQVNFGTP